MPVYKEEKPTNQPEALMEDTVKIVVPFTLMPQPLQLSSKKSLKLKKKKAKQIQSAFETTDTLSYTAGIRLGQNHLTISTKHIK